MLQFAKASSHFIRLLSNRQTRFLSKFSVCFSKSSLYVSFGTFNKASIVPTNRNTLAHFRRKMSAEINGKTVYQDEEKYIVKSAITALYPDVSLSEYLAQAIGSHDPNLIALVCKKF